MKFNILIAFLAINIFANDYYKEEKGKIDMHGGKGDSLLGSSSHFTKQKSLNSLQDLSIKKPIELEEKEIKDISIKNISNKKIKKD